MHILLIFLPVSHICALTVPPVFKGTGLVADTSNNRSNTPTIGDMRFNTTLGKYELYNGAKWQTVDPSEISMAMSIALGG